MEVGDVVLIKEKAPRNQWPLGRVVEVFHGNDNLVRTVRIQTSASKEPLTRSIVKVVLLVENRAREQ